MTTLHGLMTIAELFEGFNLINTCVVNCLTHDYVSECRQNAPFRGKKIQKFSGLATSPNPTPAGRGASILLGARLAPETKILDPPVT